MEVPRLEESSVSDSEAVRMLGEFLLDFSCFQVIHVYMYAIWACLVSPGVSEALVRGLTPSLSVPVGIGMMTSRDECTDQ